MPYGSIFRLHGASLGCWTKKTLQRKASANLEYFRRFGIYFQNWRFIELPLCCVKRAEWIPEHHQHLVEKQENAIGTAQATHTSSIQGDTLFCISSLGAFSLFSATYFNVDSPRVLSFDFCVQSTDYMWVVIIQNRHTYRRCLWCAVCKGTNCEAKQPKFEFQFNHLVPESS